MNTQDRKVNPETRADAAAEGAVGRTDTETKRGQAGAFLKQALLGLLYALYGYALGGADLPFGAKPFGVALLCGSDRRVLYVYAGLCVSAWQSQERIVLLGVYTGALVIRLLARFVLDSPWEPRENEAMREKSVRDIYPVLFTEHVGLRMASAALAAFAIGLTRLISGGFRYYDLYGTILSVLAAPVLVLLLSGFFTQTRVGLYRYISGFLTLAFVLIWAVGDVKLYGVSVAAFGCMLVTLYACRKHGIVIGMVAGTVCGLAVAPDLAPLFAFAALSAGLLFPISVSLAAISACSVGLAWGVYVDGIGVLNGLLGALVASAMLYAVLDKLFFSETSVLRESETPADQTEAVIPCAVLSERELDGVRLADTRHRIREIGEGLSALSEVFYGLSRRMRVPTSADLRQICDNAFDSACASCPEKSQCWGERYHKTTAEVGSLSALLHRNGRIESADAGEELRAVCTRLPDIVEEINHHTAEHNKQILQGDPTELFAMDYEALSRLLASAMSEQAGEYELQSDLGDRLSRAFTEERIPVSGVCAWGGRRRSVMVCAADQETLTREREAITRTVSRICPFPLQEGHSAETGEAALLFEEKEILAVSCAKRNVCAEGEDKYCGDTTGLFHHPDGRFFAFISDGMGAGREAALTSGLSGLFLRKMLGAGNSCETTLGMLNGFLRNRRSGSLHECSATVDLMELDLMKSRASFYKSGAAPTYVFRNGSLFKLRSHTVPVGILRELDTRRIGFDVSEGDVVVMVSDGVTQGKEECPWLFDLLRSQGEDASPERLADLIVKYAKGEGGTDDISVLVLKIQRS